MYSFYRMSRKELRHAIKRAEPAIFEDALRFLEDDLRTFGSGYIKELFWKYIKRYDLTPEHITRLENAAIQYLYRPMSREYKYMCQTMSRIATNDFWDKIRTYLDSDIPRVQVNAFCLNAYADGLIHGERMRLELDDIKIRLRRPGLPPYHTIDELLELLHHEENWINGKVIHKDLVNGDLPIYQDYWKQDIVFAQLDVSSGIKHKILAILDNVLTTGVMNVFNDQAWVYSIYLLQQIDDEAAVGILAKFLKDKIDYKFDGPRKSHLEMLALKVLRHYGTVEAMEVVALHKQADQSNSDYYADKDHGWAYTYP